MLRPLAAFLAGAGLLAALALPVRAGSDEPIRQNMAGLRLGDTLEDVQSIYPPATDWPSVVDPRGHVKRYKVDRGMAKAFPTSEFIGFDYHAQSIARARNAADEEGVAGRCRFEIAPAKEFPGTGYDLVAVFDCLHDMGDPVGAARHVRETLQPDGTWMIVEPFAHDSSRKISTRSAVSIIRRRR